MQKVKIKRVKRVKKDATTREKILAGVGVGSVLAGGGAGVVAAKPAEQTAVTRQMPAAQGTSRARAQELINKVFGNVNVLGVRQAKAAEEEEAEVTMEEQQQGQEATTEATRQERQNASGTSSDSEYITQSRQERGETAPLTVTPVQPVYITPQTESESEAESEEQEQDPLTVVSPTGSVATLEEDAEEEEQNSAQIPEVDDEQITEEDSAENQQTGNESGSGDSISNEEAGENETEQTLEQDEGEQQQQSAVTQTGNQNQTQASSATQSQQTVNTNSAVLSTQASGSGIFNQGPDHPVDPLSAVQIRTSGLQMPAGFGTAMEQGQGLKMPPGFPTSGGMRIQDESMARQQAAAEATYKVKKGDSLWAIAQKHYGDGRQWRKIFAENRDIIKNPSLIRVGMTLKIPDAAPLAFQANTGNQPISAASSVVEAEEVEKEEE